MAARIRQAPHPAQVKEGDAVNTHTPGPWTYDRDLMVRADAGKVEVCEVFARLFDRMLCLSDDRVRYNEEATANARLIATAPNIL